VVRRPGSRKRGTEIKTYKCEGEVLSISPNYGKKKGSFTHSSSGPRIEGS